MKGGAGRGVEVREEDIEVEEEEEEDKGEVGKLFLLPEGFFFFRSDVTARH